MKSLILNRFICFLLLIISFLIFPHSELYSNENDLVWVSRSYEGGSQCNDFILTNLNGKKRNINERPKPYLRFENKGIEIIEEYQGTRAVCEACGCPSYSFIQYFKIKKSDLEITKTFGFNTFDINNSTDKFYLKRYNDMRNRVEEQKEIKLIDNKLLDGRLKKKDTHGERNWVVGDWREGSICDLGAIADRHECPKVIQYVFYDNMMFIYREGYQNMDDDYVVAHKSRNGFYSIKDDKTIILEFVR